MKDAILEHKLLDIHFGIFNCIRNVRRANRDYKFVSKDEEIKEYVREQHAEFRKLLRDRMKLQSELEGK